MTGHDNISGIVSKVALLVASLVAIALPLAYAVIAYADFSHDLEFKAKVKATAFSGLITSSPEVWTFAENRMQGLLAREPVPLESEAVHVYDDAGAVITQAGREPAPPVLRRSHLLYDATRVAGRIEVSSSLRPLLWGTAASAAIGLLLAALVFTALRSIPLRALRRASEALFEQTERSTVTLQSIGDAVITTDATGRVDFLNPTAEALLGCTAPQAAGLSIDEVVRLQDTETGHVVPSAVHRALRLDRTVSVGHEFSLRLSDGRCVEVDERAAPIHDGQGEVIGSVLVLRDVSAERNQARQRSWDASHDSLTGLANRREFERLVDRATSSVRETAKQHVVCYMDLDQFKVVNDTCGHAAGDDLLKRLAELLLARIRGADTLARLGGDEFGLLLEGCSLEHAEIIAAELLAAIGDFRFQWEDKLFSVGASIGIAMVEADITAIEALGLADTACYWAKEQGRNRVCVYRRDDGELEARRRQVGWITRINAALAEDRFVLYQQRYLALGPNPEGQVHLEVLVRMIGEDGKLIPPGSFLPAAERYNLMPAIDRWVVRQVFSRHGELVARHGGAPVTCAINLSATTINAEGFLEFVHEQMREHRLPAGAICFEITESSAINNLRNAIEFMRQCKALGLQFALDDFGIGMSSFGYLRDLPVDYLKIDGSFVKDLGHDEVDRAMTEAINRIGHIMGIKTVAEYAESEAVIEALRRMGVDYAQGYGVCRPSPLLEPAQGAPAVADAAAAQPAAARRPVHQ